MATATAVSTPGGGSYPVAFDVEYPAELSRWLIFVKWLLGIPHYIITYLLQYALFVVWVIAFFAILFTKKYPRGMFNFAVGANRWYSNYLAYTLLLRDEYPPFSMDPGQYPVTFTVEYPQELSRWLILVKWLLVIPNAIVLILIMLVAYLVTIIAFFAVLFTKKYPESMFKFVVGALRWNQRVTAYILFMRDEYPPFSMEP